MDSQRVLRVKGWQEHFESAKSRTYKSKRQAYLPAKQGLGYRRLLSTPHGEAAFGAWCALCQVLSRQDLPRQGYCTDTGLPSGCPWSPDDIALLTGYKSTTVERMIEACLSPQVGWLEVVTAQGYHKDTTGIPQCPYPLPLPLPSHSPAKKADVLSAKDVLAAFDEFWALYPRKVGVGRAREKYKIATRAAKPAEILAGLQAQLPAMQSKIAAGETRFVCHAATWLHQERWNDAPEKPTRASSGSHGGGLGPVSTHDGPVTEL